jgi:hypothetical protein
MRRYHNRDYREIPPFWRHRINSGKQELVNYCKWNDRWAFRSQSVTSSLLDVSWSWQIATALGDDEWTESLDEARSRLREAILRRDASFVLLSVGVL